MSILTASQDAIAKLVGRRPPAVVSSTEEICVEVTAIAQEAAEDISKAHDWQNLTEFHTITANGTDSAYPFPSDYDRMVQASGLYDPNGWAWGYCHITDYGEWLQMLNSGFGMLTPGAWTIRKNQFHFLPAPEAGQQAVFPYISNALFTDANGNPKQRITQDSDKFVLGDRLLTLAIIWRHRALKGGDYQQEIEDYNIALSQDMARDKGSRVIRSGRRLYGDFRPAYPWPLG